MCGRGPPTTVKIAKDEEPDPNLRTLEFKKNNYGPIAKSIALRWERGIYVPNGGIGSVDKLAKEHARIGSLRSC